MKSASKIILFLGLLTVAGVVLFLIAQRSSEHSEHEGAVGARNTGRTDSSEALIDEAINKKDEAVCEGVRQTTRPGPTDGTMTIFGDDAVSWCKEQVRQGGRIQGG